MRKHASDIQEYIELHNKVRIEVITKLASRGDFESAIEKELTAFFEEFSGAFSVHPRSKLRNL